VRFGVQNGRWPPEHAKNTANSGQLSHLRKTCHSRYFPAKRLILLTQLVSVFSKKSDTDTTFPAKNPTFGYRMGVNTTALKQSSQYSECPVSPPFDDHAKSVNSAVKNLSVDD
jgi:hypothetical protein